MAAIAVTYLFSNATTADAGQVNTNFNDLIGGLSDGTKDLTVSAIACASLITSGDATIGNNSADSFVVNALVNSNLIPEMASGAYTLGDTSNQWKALYLDNGVTDGGSLYFNGGTTAYFKSNAAGTIATLGGFTELDMTTFKLKDSNLSKASAPSANTMHLNSMVKACATLTCGGAGAVTVTDGFNVASASYSGNDITVTLHTAMADANYMIIVSNRTISVTNAIFSSGSATTTTFVIRKATPTTGSGTAVTSSDVVSILILGNQ